MVYLPLVETQVTESSAVAVITNRELSEIAPLFSSETLEPGQQFSYTFSTEGNYTYIDPNDSKIAAGTVQVAPEVDSVTQAVDHKAGGTIVSASGAVLRIEPNVLLTDTIASITSLGSFFSEDDPDTPVGPTFDIRVAGSTEILSGTLEIELPYDPTMIPEGLSENDVRAATFNGHQWVILPSTPNIDRDTVTVSTTHLSDYVAVTSCRDPFSLSEEERIDFNHGMEYLGVLSDHQDMYEVITDDNGEPLFELNKEGAEWLAAQKLCNLPDLESEIRTKLSEDLSPQDVVDGIVKLGRGLSSQEFTSELIGDLHRIHTGLSIVSAGVKVAEIALLGGSGGVSLVAHLFVEALMLPIGTLVFEDIPYLRDMSWKFNDINTYLNKEYVMEVGRAGTPRVQANRVTVDDWCGPHYESSDKGFFKQVVPGYSPESDGDPYAQAYHNLFSDGNTVKFVLGTMDLSKFYAREGYEGLSRLNKTDFLLVLIFYENEDNETLVNRMLLRNTKTAILDICVASEIELPGIKEGSPVRVTYYLIEKGRIDTRYDDDGVIAFWDPPWSCNGPCEPNHPPGQIFRSDSTS